MVRLGLLGLLVFGAMDLSGRYEVQSLGADRELTIKQKGNKLIFHRVMWPEFEGEKYKLEHMYKGTLVGTTLSGKLFVKDDETPKFEELRPFTGSISPEGAIVIDGMPLKKVDGAASKSADSLEGEESERASAAPSLS